MGKKACLLLGALLLAGCVQRAPQLTVAAASNLTPAFDRIGAEFTAETGIPVVFSYAATTILARQVEESAPFDVFAAADNAHVDRLAATGRIVPESRAVYARGQLAVWAPGGAVRELSDLAGPQVRFVAIAQPQLAPYGAAAIEALKAAGLWEAVQPKLVYANNISQARQFAASGNADAAFTAYSLVMQESGVVRPDARLYGAIEQAIGVIAASPRRKDARRFTEFVLGPRGHAILAEHGYLAP
jgi:molybdate transport system substrate-binding protein